MMKEVPWKRVLLAVFIFFGISAFVVFHFKKDDHRYQVSVLAIFQDEGRFLKEWLDFHQAIGVDHFYLFNNLSVDDYQQVLDPYISAGIVELHEWPFASKPGSEADWTRIQSGAYREGLKLAKGQSKWVAIIDTDEFLFPSHGKDLKSFLKDYDNCSGVLVNWQVFGTSHVEKIPDDKLLIETLTMQARPDAVVNTFCKSIVRPEAVKTCNDPHTVVYYPWSYAVDPDHCIFPWKFHKFRPVKIDKIRINHYWTRDEVYFYTNKLARYENWGNKKQACLQRNEEANDVVNEDIFVWIPRMRKESN